MANVSGAAAYQRLQVPEDGMNQSLQFWGAQQAKENADKKLADEREDVRQTQALKEWEAKTQLKEGDFKNKYTGFKSFDDVNTDFSMYATQRYVDLQRKALQARESGDNVERLKYESEMIRLKNDFGEVAKSQDFFAKKFADYQKAVSEGRVSGASKDFENIIQEALVNKNIALRYIDGNLAYTGLKNGKEPFVIPYQDLMDGSFSWFEKQDIDGKGGIVDNISDSLGTITRQSDKGYYKISTQAWSDKIHGESVDKAIDALLGNKEVMGDLLYQISGGNISKMRDFKDKEYELVKDNLRTRVRAKYSEKFSSEFNTSRYNTDVDASIARQRMAMERSSSKGKDVNKDLVEAEPITDVKGNLVGGYSKTPFKTSEGVVNLGGAYTLKTKGGTPIKGILQDDSEAEILSIRKSGDRYFAQTRVATPTTEKDDMTGSTRKVVKTDNKIIPLNNEELNRLARRMNLNTAKDLDNYLEERRQNYSNKAQDPMDLGFE